ncbi:MAG: hypothetical protein HC919_04885 [Oscillatoriales cyanobacterium SM2_2_1]|nr:hypothetical protein [Oscillatoriales cyanobacterium SM2_2_1]
MARYTHCFTAALQPEHLHQTIVALLESCGLQITYKTDDYVMAQEIKGDTAFSRMVTVEILIHQSEIVGERVKLTCVTKNEELPLKKKNHCAIVAERVRETFMGSEHWQLLETTVE